jgi:hypothetical protein
MAHSFEVVGLDDSYTVLHETTNSTEAIRWARAYIEKQNAGGWNILEIYDVRGEESERVWFWEAE